MSNPRQAIGLGAILLTAGALSGVGFLTLAGTNAILAGFSAGIGRKQAPSFREHQGIEINFTGEKEPIARVYGEVKVGGHLSIIGTGDTNNRDLYYAVTHSVANACGIEDITDVWIDKRRIDETDIDGSGDFSDGVYDGFVNFREALGTDTETADADISGTLPFVDSNARGDYMAKSYWTFLRDLSTDAQAEKFNKAFRRGAPQIQAIVKGQKCYDPRLDSTNGGSGAHRLNNPSTWEYTRNPILCAVDYALAEALLGGIEIDDTLVDWTSVAAAANVCDETVTVPDGAGGTTTQVRYTCDIALDTGEDTKKNIEKILGSCFGVVVYALGTDTPLRFYAGEYEAPATTVDDSWLAGGVSVRRLTEISQQYNAVRSTFIDPGANHEVVQSEPFTDATYETQDGGKRKWKEVEWAAVQNRYRAQYMNTVLGRMSRNQQRVSAKLNMRALDIEVWEVVTLDFPDIDVSGSFRVISWQWREDGPEVEFEQIASDTFDSSIGIYTEINPESKPGETLDTPAAPSSPSATATADGIALKWTNPGLGEFSEIIVERADDDGGSPDTGTWAVVWSGRASSWIDPITNGAKYHYRLKARSATGVDQFSSYSSTVTATAKTVADGATVGAPAGTNVGSTDAATVEGNAEDGWNLTQPGSGIQLGDSRNQRFSQVGNRQSVQTNTSVITSVYNSISGTSSATVAAHTLRIGGVDLSMPSGGVTGLPPGVTRYVYADCPDLTDVSGITYAATGAYSTTLNGTDRYYVGKIVTATSGSGNTSGGGGGGTDPP